MAIASQTRSVRVLNPPAPILAEVPVPDFLKPPAIDDVADGIERLTIPMGGKIGEEIGPTARGVSDMKIVR
jgi:hypothetical protein